MSCSKCDIEDIVKNKAKTKNITIKNPNILARIIYERLQKNQAIFGRKVDTIKKNGMDIGIENAAKALALYKHYFAESTKIKLKPVKNLEEIEKARDILYGYEDKMWKAKRAYEELAEGVDIEESLLKARIEVRKNLNETILLQETKKVHVTENFIRKRQFDPSDCIEGSYRTFEKDGNKIVGCKRKSSGKFEAQSILVPRKGKESTSKQEIKLKLIKENPDLSKDLINDLVG